MNKSIIQTSDPECKHTARPIDLVRLNSQPGEKAPIIVSIFEAPGPNYLREVLNFGPAFYGGRGRMPSVTSATANQVPVQFFLDFAIGACECLELLHHGHRTVHGEIRADAFHYNQETGAVKLVNVGNGPRAFENGLTSEGWITLSREIGVKNKLQFIAPEQTGRLPAEPDSRTDIYSLGVLFWTMLVGQPGFDGDTPMDVVQNVLSRRLPLVSSKRMDVPDAISNIIQKMTLKQIDERYHSVSGLKHDLIEVQKLLSNGDVEALKDFKIAQKDVSSFFVLPCTIIGRQREQDLITKIIDKVLKRQQAATHKANAHALYSIDSNSSISESRVDSFEIADIVEGSSESSSQGVKDSRSNSTVGPLFYSSINNFNQTSNPNSESPILLNKPSLPFIQHSKNSIESRNSWETMEKESFMPNGMGGNHQYDTLGPLARRRGSHKFRRRGRCEVVSIFGGAGMGKTSLMQIVQPAIRKHGLVILFKNG
jgi:serine/threonine protein kinase